MILFYWWKNETTPVKIALQYSALESMVHAGYFFLLEFLCITATTLLCSGLMTLQALVLLCAALILTAFSFTGATCIIAGLALNGFSSDLPRPWTLLSHS